MLAPKVEHSFNEHLGRINDRFAQPSKDWQANGGEEETRRILVEVLDRRLKLLDGGWFVCAAAARAIAAQRQRGLACDGMDAQVGAGTVESRTPRAAAGAAGPTFEGIGRVKGEIGEHEQGRRMVAQPGGAWSARGEQEDHRVLARRPGVEPLWRPKELQSSRQVNVTTQ